MGTWAPGNFTTNKKRPGFKESRDARTALPQNCSTGKICQQAGERNATLEQLIGTKGPPARPHSVVTSVTSRVVSESLQVLERVFLRFSFLSGGEIRLLIANLQLLRFVGGVPPAGFSFPTIERRRWRLVCRRLQS